METYSSIPSSFVVGDTLVIEIELSDYPAPTYELTLTLISSSEKHSFTSSASGSIHQLTVDTTTISAGNYGYQLQLAGAGYISTYQTGRITADPNFADASVSTYDNREWYETAIDALEASIAGRASKTQMRQVVFGSEVQEMTQIEQLTFLHKLYVIKRQADAQKSKGKGRSLGKTIGVRF